MKTPIETIGTHTATGAGARVSKLGAEGPQDGIKIADKTRIVQISGIAGGTIIKIEASIDNANWADYVTGISADCIKILDDGPLFIRSNCTTYGSGTCTVRVQKFIQD